MNSEATTELIWHFAGQFRLAQDFHAYRVRYEEVFQHNRVAEFDAMPLPEESRAVDVPGLKSMPTRAHYSPRPDQSERIEIQDVGHPHLAAVIDPEAPLVKLFEPEDLEFHSDVQDSGSFMAIVHRIIVRGHSHPADPNQGMDAPPQPVYTMDYADGGDDRVVVSIQQSMISDRDFFSDSGEDYASLQGISSSPIQGMLGKAKEFVPDLLQPAGKSLDFWTSTLLDHHEDLAAGMDIPETVEAGRYVNGGRQGEAVPSLSKIGPTAPAIPDRAEDQTQGQVAQLGANTAQNFAVVTDLNDAPSTLIVGGNYFETNAVLQANILKNADHAFMTGTALNKTPEEESRTDNIANFANKELAAAHSANAYAGDLKINIEFADGDFVDTKAFIQRNYLNDGDVSVQTRTEGYSQVVTGENGQYNAVKFADWGKHYDIIVVIGDYHSANIISQANILLDSDIVAVGKEQEEVSDCEAAPDPDGVPAGGGQSLTFADHNAFHNEASITKYGAAGFSGLTSDLDALIAALENRETVDREAWSSFHGVASGRLDVLVVTGDYYDINIISQVNVVSDADLALQMNAYSGGQGTQWLSTGGNLLANQAAIIDAGGLYQQYLGGRSYEDSVLVQANLVSDSFETTAVSHPTALVPELVAFMDAPEDSFPAEAETWTWSTYGNHDGFGHVLT